MNFVEIRYVRTFFFSYSLKNLLASRGISFLLVIFRSSFILTVNCWSSLRDLPFLFCISSKTTTLMINHYSFWKVVGSFVNVCFFIFIFVFILPKISWLDNLYEPAKSVTYPANFSILRKKTVCKILVELGVIVWTESQWTNE